MNREKGKWKVISGDQTVFEVWQQAVTGHPNVKELDIVIKGEKTYSYRIDLEACLQEGNLWIGEAACQVENLEIGQVLLCPDCNKLSCAFLDINPLE